ncbi:MAG: tetratricopeptide repeat protein [Hyphomicrobiales bacterium]|nr:tetratricopeptide repeat protein [Hyphomicrobiales bacterium]
MSAMILPADHPPSGEPPFSVDQALTLAVDHFRSGRLEDAGKLCQRILAVAPRHAPTLHLYGIIAYRGGALPESIRLLRQAIAADGDVAHYHADLGEILRLNGERDEALVSARRALDLNPNNSQAHSNLGSLHYEGGEFDEALTFFERVIALEPRSADAYCNLGNTLRARGNVTEAAAAYRRAIALRPGYAAAFNNLGTALRELNQLEEAENAYRQSLALNPNDPITINNLALALRDLERFEEASALLQASLSLAPGNAKTLTYVALIRLDQNRPEEAHRVAQKAVADLPDDPETLNAMGLSLYELGHAEEALAFYRRALACRSNFAGACNNMGNVFKQAGALGEAYAAYSRSLAIDPRQADVFVNLTDLRKVKADDPCVAQMEAMARDMDALPRIARMRLHFALAKAHDDLGNADEAFQHMRKGNALKRAQIIYDEPAALAFFDRIRESFDAKLIKTKSGNGDPSPLPIFVLGMPRSGTTLVEQILASHPDVHGAGELAEMSAIVGRFTARDGEPLCFPEAVQAMASGDFTRLGREYASRLRRYSATATRITDKMPSNFCFVGLIHLSLPQARIVHVMRDPLDTCLSCFSRLFSAEQNHTYDLAELGRYYRKYAELMEHWRAVLPQERLLEVRYEEVIADLEEAARRIIAHCGLAWSEDCLAFHKNRRQVKTASASQVRRPIYKTAQGRARAYRQHLSPLIAELGDLVDAEVLRR